VTLRVLTRLLAAVLGAAAEPPAALFDCRADVGALRDRLQKGVGDP
jgi:hypothetical protein